MVLKRHLLGWFFVFFLFPMMFAVLFVAVWSFNTAEPFWRFAGTWVVLCVCGWFLCWFPVLLCCVYFPLFSVALGTFLVFCGLRASGWFGLGCFFFGFLLYAVCFSFFFCYWLGSSVFVLFLFAMVFY